MQRQCLLAISITLFVTIVSAQNFSKNATPHSSSQHFTNPETEKLSTWQEFDEKSKNPSEEQNGSKTPWTQAKKMGRNEEAVDDALPREEDFIEAADFGMQAMNELYLVKEPKLYSMGLFLSTNDPARYVAAFNAQTEEAKLLAKFGYAALEAARKFRSKFPDISRQAPVLQKIDKTTLRQQCPRKGIPECPPASLRYRTSDGSCNNLKELWWGSAMSTMQRFLPQVYDDNIQSIRRSVTGSLLPSARQISNYIHEERDSPLTSVTHMLMQWGQFIDHDITATGQSRAFNGSVPQCCLRNGIGFQPPEFMHPECLPIAVHPEDTHLGKLDIHCLEFVRSGPAPREDCEFGAREQLSQVTSFIDASTVYSSSARQSDSLRIFRNGLLQYGKLISRKPVLPRDDSDLCRRGSLSTNCFRAGDARLSEQPGLISLHVVFLRMHNRLATQLAAMNQHWSDERIFQESRKIVAALIQHITYREFLPIVLGHDIMKIFDIELLRKGYYEGYDESVNPNIANEFSTAAFRFGHSLVQHSFVRFDKNHQPIFNNVTIHEEFSNPANLETPGSVDRILLGLVNQPSQKRDEYISEELTNHLFQTPGFSFGMDLAALNIQRGRDHGIPPFIDWRQPCRLSPIRNWNDLDRIMAPETARKFQDLYSAVEDIDLFSAGLAEKPVTGGLVGPTLGCIIAQQFRTLRKGDRFWYENPFVESGFTLAQLEQIRRVTLAQVLCRTMDNIDSIQPFVMLAADNLRNQRITCQDSVLDQINLEPWKEKPLRQLQTFAPNEEFQFGREDSEAITVDVNDKEKESRSAAKSKPDQRLPPRQKPVKTRINQQNRITVKRPLGPHENLTVIVNNNAVNSPIFVTDSIYGSNFHINHFSNNPLPQYIQPNYPNNPSPTQRPKPTQRPHDYSFTQSMPYFPQNFQDPNNPNPPNYGFNTNPFGNYFPNNQFHQNYPNSQNNNNNNNNNYASSEHNENQQNSYFTTKRPNTTKRPLALPPFTEYAQHTPSTYPFKKEDYDQYTNRSHESNYSYKPDKDSYSNSKPNHPNQDGFNPNYYSRPTNKPKRPHDQTTPIHHTEHRPDIQVPSNSNDQTNAVVGPATDQVDYQNINYNLPIGDNSQSKSHYLHTHTTVSDIQYHHTPAHGPQRYKLKTDKTDQELPRPLVSPSLILENREASNANIEQVFKESESVIDPQMRPEIKVDSEPNFKSGDQVETKLS